MRAGIPNIVMPFTADQPFWGNEIYTLGGGPKPIFVKNISVDNLVKSITKAEAYTIRDRVQAVGQKIRSEDGVKDAVKLMKCMLLSSIQM
ncbi:MAG: hypothetical protein U0V02_17040 [Anaerolineales bacterium]